MPLGSGLILIRHHIMAVTWGGKNLHTRPAVCRYGDFFKLPTLPPHQLSSAQWGHHLLEVSIWSPLTLYLPLPEDPSAHLCSTFRHQELGLLMATFLACYLHFVPFSWLLPKSM